MSKSSLHIGIIVLVSILLRLPSFWIPVLDVDETQFAGFANAILDGGIPYIASVDTKPPGIYFLFALLFAIFGKNNLIAVHLITTIVNTATALLCYKIAKSFHSEKTGFFAGLLFAVFSTCLSVKTIGTSIMSIAILPITASIYFLIRWVRNGKHYDMFFSGILLGISCIFKYQAGINIFVIIFYLGLFGLFSGKMKSGTILAGLLRFVAGGVCVLAALLIYLYKAGALNAFQFWSIGGGFKYIEATIGNVNYILVLIGKVKWIIFPSTLLWILFLYRLPTSFLKK